MKEKKSLREKMAEEKGLPKIVVLPDDVPSPWKPGKMVIVAPGEVDELMRLVPKGKVTTIGVLREELARRHDAQCTCPTSTGIFARLSAEVAEEDAALGRKDITPYWRTLKAGGELNPKFPGGLDGLKAKLEAEGHKVIQKGKRAFVAEFEKTLFSF
ncbi:MAG: MGMT family protein [Candidatus Brocadiia bacterium]